MQTQLLMVRMQTTHNTDTATDGASTNHPEHTHNYGWCIYKPPTAQTQLQMACLQTTAQRQTTQSTDTMADGVHTTRDKPAHGPHRERPPKCDKGHYSLWDPGKAGNSSCVMLNSGVDSCGGLLTIPTLEKS